MNKDVPLSTCIRIKTLKRAGHVIRTEDYPITKKVLGRSFGGERPVGKTRSRWEDNVQKDAVSLFHILSWNSAEKIERIGGWKLGSP